MRNKIKSKIIMTLVSIGVFALWLGIFVVFLILGNPGLF